eukprot:351225-Chlamydomonas_euryale.AAC.1
MTVCGYCAQAMYATENLPRDELEEDLVLVGLVGLQVGRGLRGARRCRVCKAQGRRNDFHPVSVGFDSLRGAWAAF